MAKALSWAEFEITGLFLPATESSGSTESPTSGSPTTGATSNPTSKAPTDLPSVGPESSPTSTSPPTQSPSESITALPTGSPSKATSPPSKASSESSSLELVANIWAGSTVTDFGCISSDASRSTDSTTNKYYCNRNGISDPTESTFQIPGIIIRPINGQLSIPRELRVYTSDACTRCDPRSYYLQGRVSNTEPWVEIASGQFPGVTGGDTPLLRNDQGLQITSTYENGDPSLTYTSVSYPNISDVYLEYKLWITGTRGVVAKAVSWAEVEMAGVLLPLPPSTSPTMAPTTEAPTAELPVEGELVANVLAGNSFTDFGCVSSDPSKSSDSTTNKYSCNRVGINDPTLSTFAIPGIIATSMNGQLSIPKELRVYTSNACTRCDPRSYYLQGRVSSTLPWVEIAFGEFPGVTGSDLPLPRNEQALPINSTYESGDPNLAYSSVKYPEISDAYLEYRLWITGTRAPIAKAVSWAEIEIAGMLLPLA